MTAFIVDMVKGIFVEIDPWSKKMKLKSVLTESQRLALWKFVRDDLGVREFESWLYDETALETAFDDVAYLALIGCDFRNKDDTSKIKASIRAALEPKENCRCSAVRNLDNIEMGGDFFFEKFFATLTKFVSPQTEQWWLYISRCDVCATNWLIAQEERIHDQFYVERISDQVARDATEGNWPDRFQTYADVLETGVKLNVSQCTFLDPMSGALQVTVEELLQTVPKISAEEVGTKLGIAPDHAKLLMDKVSKDGADPMAGYIDTK